MAPVVTCSPGVCSFPCLLREGPGCRRCCPVGPLAPGSATAEGEQPETNNKKRERDRAKEGESRQGKACEVRAKNKYLAWLLKALLQPSRGRGRRVQGIGAHRGATRGGPAQAHVFWGMRMWWEAGRAKPVPGGWNIAAEARFFIHSALISAPRPCSFIPLFIHSFTLSLQCLFPRSFLHLHVLSHSLPQPATLCLSPLASGQGMIST